MTNYIVVVIVKTTWEDAIFSDCHVQGAAMTHLVELPPCYFSYSVVGIISPRKKTLYIKLNFSVFLWGGRGVQR